MFKKILDGRLNANIGRYKKILFGILEFLFLNSGFWDFNPLLPPLFFIKIRCRKWHFNVSSTSFWRHFDIREHSKWLRHRHDKSIHQSTHRLYVRLTNLGGTRYMGPGTWDRVHGTMGLHGTWKGRGTNHRRDACSLSAVVLCCIWDRSLNWETAVFTRPIKWINRLEWLSHKCKHIIITLNFSTFFYLPSVTPFHRHVLAVSHCCFFATRRANS